jgi:hypothetical protein
MTDAAKCLNRTLLLMRDEFGSAISDKVLLDALRGTRVALIADAANLASHSAQTAFVTAAMLMARSGHQVFLAAPNIAMKGPQPPLQPGALIDQLVDVGKDLLPDFEFFVVEPEAEVDLAIALGDSQFNFPALRQIRLNADDWAGMILPADRPNIWQGAEWPFGGLVTAALAAAEAFKATMNKLLHCALNQENTADRFAIIRETRYELAPTGTPFCRDLGDIDCVSGGAITNSALYCLARIPDVTANGRIIEPDLADSTNLNRYPLLLRSHCGRSKAHELAKILPNGFHFEPIASRYEPQTAPQILPFAPTVIVGVDHISTRWVVQEAMPKLLVIGASTHWGAMASFHSRGLACARCLHYRDDDGNGPLATTACVSFWAGLLTATYVVRHAAGETISPFLQQVFMMPYRPENTFLSGVAVRSDCPICHPTGRPPTSYIVYATTEERDPRPE